MKPGHAWVVHNNCSRGCSHCFLSSATPDDADVTEILVEDLERHGIGCRVYAAQQLDGQLDRLRSRVKNVPLVAGEASCGRVDFGGPGSDRIAFSLHGPDAATHELLAPKGDFAAILADREQLRSAIGTRGLQLFCVIHGRNWERLEETCDFFRALGAEEAHFVKLCYAGRSVDLPDDFFLTGAQIRRFLGDYFRIRNRFGPMRVTLANSWGPHPSRFKQLIMRWLGSFRPGRFCDCGGANVAIKSDSREVFPCRYAITIPALKMGRFDSRAGLLLDGSWLDGLAEHIGAPCRGCRILAFCQGGCRAIAVTEKLRAEGILDVHAGFRNCPVSLGATQGIDLTDDIAFVLRGVRKAFG